MISDCVGVPATLSMFSSVTLCTVSSILWFYYTSITPLGKKQKAIQTMVNPSCLLHKGLEKGSNLWGQEKSNLQTENFKTPWFAYHDEREQKSKKEELDPVCSSIKSISSWSVRLNKYFCG